MEQVLLFVHANLEVLPDPQYLMVSFNLLKICLKDGRASINNCHRALDRNNFNPQPFARCPSLLDFARIFLPIKHIFSCSKIWRTKLHLFSKISTDIFSLLNFKMSPHGQFLNFFIEQDPVWLVWMSAALDSWKLGPGDLLVFVPWPPP